MSELVERTSEDMQAAESSEFALQALDAIENVKSPDEAEALLAKVKVAAEAARVMHLGKALSREWRSIEIKAERKWGELLGAADRSTSMQGNSNRQNSVSETHTEAPTAAERTAVKEARKLAAVPEEVFAEYVEEAEVPSKAGLLRAADKESINAAEEPVQHAESPALTKRQENVAGIAARIKPHSLRHAFGDHVTRQAGLRAAQEVLGHADVSTTEGTYTGRPTLDELSAALAWFRYDGYPSASTPEAPDAAPFRTLPAEASSGDAAGADPRGENP